MNREETKRRTTAERENRERVKQYFAKTYNKRKEIEFKSGKKINMRKHFFVYKNTLSSMGLSKRAMALYPVLCSFADFRESNWFQISIENLCKFTGMGHTTVTKALEELKSKEIVYSDHTGATDDTVVPILEIKKESKGSRRYNMYKVEFARENLIKHNKGKTIVLHAMLFDTGLWSKLSMRAKSLYLYLRVNAVFDLGFVGDWSDLRDEGKTFLSGDDFFNRGFDALVLNLRKISTDVGINSNELKCVLNELNKHGLCSWEEGYCLVYLTPNKGEFAINEM